METGRTVPYSEEAERGLLGAMILAPEKVVPLAQGLEIKPACFYVPAHRLVSEALSRVFDKRQGRMDVLLLAEELRQGGQLESVGGEGFLHRLMDATPTAEHAAYYADIVKQKALLRSVIEEARTIEQEAFQAERADGLLTALPERFAALGQNGSRDERGFVELLDEFIDDCEKAREAREAGEQALPGLETPWAGLNDLLSGWQEGLVIVGGRPSEGKTSLASQAAVFTAAQGDAVGWVTLDLTQKKLVRRDLCRMAGVSLAKAMAGYARQSQIAALREMRDVMARYPLYLSTHVEVESACGWIRMMRLRHGIKMVWIDHLGLQRLSGKQGFMPRYVEVGEITTRLHNLAGELEMPIGLLCQLSRDPLKAGTKPRRPILSDLRDSGRIEEDAAVVVFVNHDLKCKAAALKDDDLFERWKKKRPVVVEVAKHQDGEIGTLEFWMYPHYFRFEEAEDGFGEWAPQKKTEPGAAAVDAERAEGERKLHELALQELGPGFASGSEAGDE